MFSPLLATGLLARLAAVPLAYWLMWFGTLGLSIVLVVLLRTRWGQSRPLHKCAVLSLLVHLLLAWAAMTLRIVMGDGGGGSPGPPIRVRIVHDAIDGAVLAILPLELAPAPPLLEPQPETEPSVAEPHEKIAETPETPPVHEPSAAEAIHDNADVHDAAVAATDEAATESELAPEPGTTASLRAPAETEPAVAVTPSGIEHPAPSTERGASPYSLRTAPGRLGLVERQGGNAQTEAAVAAALRWLAAAQLADGRWDANRFGAGQEQMVLGHNRGGAGRDADTGISALALLAFLGAGHTHLDGEYHDTVRRGLDFLLRSQAADGNLFAGATLYAQMYCHSMATFALAEAQAMTGDRRLEPAVAKAVSFCLATQNATTGGWRYRPGDTGDTSQLGWQMMALASAQRAGVEVPSHSWVRVERFLRSVRRGTHGGLASYRPETGHSTPMTAEALYCRLLLAEVLGEAIDEAAAIQATTQLLAALPDAERINLYYWYYATLALHHRQLTNDRAASAWRAWNDALAATLVATQVTAGPDAGSWNTNTVWGGYGGRVYTTATAAMCLEVYYRYAPPATRDRWTATRLDPQPAR